MALLLIDYFQKGNPIIDEYYASLERLKEINHEKTAFK